MALSKQDKEWIQLTVSKAVTDGVEPIAKMVGEHEQSLYGIDRNNGMRSQVKWLNRFAWTVTGGIILAGTILGAIKIM